MSRLKRTAAAEAEGQAVRVEDELASRPEVRRSDTFVVDRTFVYTDERGKTQAAGEGSTIVPLADVPEGSSPNTPVSVVITKKGGSVSKPGVIMLGELQDKIGSGEVTRRALTEEEAQAVEADKGDLNTDLNTERTSTVAETEAVAEAGTEVAGDTSVENTDNEALNADDGGVGAGVETQGVENNEVVPAQTLEEKRREAIEEAKRKKMANDEAKKILFGETGKPEQQPARGDSEYTRKIAGKYMSVVSDENAGDLERISAIAILQEQMRRGLTLTDEQMSILESVSQSMRDKGYEWDGLVGQSFDSGTKAESDIIEDERLDPNAAIVTGFRKPQILKEGELVQSAEVTVTQGRRNTESEVETGVAEPVQTAVELYDNQGNPIDENGELVVEPINSIEDLTDEDFENPTRNVQLPPLPENVSDAIGSDGKPVVIKKSIFEKNKDVHPEFDPKDSRSILTRALYNPDLAGLTQPKTRPYYRVVIQTGDMNAVVVLDVYENKSNTEIVGWREMNERGLEKLKRQAEREDGQLLILSPGTPSGSAAALSALPSDLSSADKGTEVSEEKQVRLPENPVAAKWNALVADNEGDEAEALDTAVQMVGNKTAELEQARKISTKGKTEEAIQEAKRAKREKVSALETELRFWQDVAGYPEKKRASEAQAAELNARLERERKRKEQQASNPNYGLRQTEADDRLGAPLSLREYVIRKIATGRVKFLWSGSESGTGGLKEHGGAAKRQMLYTDKTRGAYPEDVAEAMRLDIMDNHPEFGQVDASDILSEIEDLAVGEQTPSEMMEEAARLHERSARFVTDTREVEDVSAEVAGMAPAAVTPPAETEGKESKPRFAGEVFADEEWMREGDAGEAVPFQRVQGADLSPLATDRQAKAIARQLKKLGLKGDVRIVDGVGELVKAARARLQSVFHGSPHAFEAFDFSHMGSGEGAQAYGWGGYVTEVEKIGRTYAEELAGKDDKLRENKIINDLVREHLERNSKEEALSYLQSLLNESWSDKKRVKAQIKILETGRFLKEPIRHLYHVEIPTERDGNYLRWEEPVSDGSYLMDELMSALRREMENDTEFWEKKGEDAWKENHRDPLDYWLEETGRDGFMFDENSTGKEIYESISRFLGRSDKAASEFLSSLGFVGISYPAQYQSGGRADNARNYVIFKESDMKITDHIRYEQDASGEIAGATLPNGDVLLNRRAMRVDTPFHEFAHKLFTYAKENRGASRLYDAIRRYAREAPQGVKDYVAAHYPGLSEDAYLDEVFAWALSRQSEGGLEAFLKERGIGADDTASRTWYERVWDAVKSLWAEVRPRVSRLLGRDFADLSVFDAYDEMGAEETGKALYGLLMGGKRLPGAEQAVEGADVRAQSESAEEAEIERRSKADGTWLKAPNGKPTKLTPKQWVQVRTKAFKDWFGDWEKAARIEKLRDSKPIEITGNEIEASDDLNQYKKNALDYGKTLRGEYENHDTGSKISVNAASIKEVLHHDVGDVAHIQSIAAIPAIVEDGIYIDTVANEDTEKNPKVREYQYYVAGLKIGDVDYTVKSVIAVDNNGNRYYDHALTKIEKGNLLNELGGITSPASQKASPLSDIKDKRLLSILQTNSSKVVDGNGEPLVVYHGSPSKFFAFDTNKIGSSTGTSDGRGFYFTTARSYAEGYGGAEGQTLDVFLNIRKPLSLEKKTITKRQLQDIIRRIDEKEFADDGEHWLISNYGNYYENSIDNIIRKTADVEYGYNDNDVELFNSLVGASGNFDLVMRAVSEATGKSGEISPKRDGTVHYIVFNPTDIKSATDNVGTFDAGNPDIRYQKKFFDGLDADGVYDGLLELSDYNYGGASRLIGDLETYYGGALESASGGAKRAMERGLVPFSGTKYSGLDLEYHHMAFVDENGERNVEAVPFTTPEALRESRGDLRFRFAGDMFDAEGRPKNDDAAYLAAVERGDMETAQRMVNEAAARAGYNAPSDYQGSLAFNGAAPSKNGYFDTKEERKAAWENGEYEGEMSLGDFVDSNIDTHDLGWHLTDPGAQRNVSEYTQESIDNLSSTVKSGKRTIKMYRAVDASIKENSFRNGDWITPSRKYAQYHIGLQDWKGGRIIEQEVSVDDIWWDGDDINEWGYDNGKDYGYRNTENNRKLLDAVTRDDAGNIIPLSKRFDQKKSDARYRFIGEKGAANLDKAEEATTRLDNLAVARDMEEAGKDAKAVKMATGWERGVDGKWRYEVQDFEIDARGLARKGRLWQQLTWGEEFDRLSLKLLDGKELTREEASRFDELSDKADEMRKSYEESDVRYLDDYVKDSDLFEAYPDLKHMRIEIYSEPNSNTGATYYSGKNLIRINEQALEAESLRGILSHEVQHAIQAMEGFARGGNDSTYKMHLDSLKEKQDAWSMIKEFDSKRDELGQDALPIDVYNAVRDEYLSLGFDFGGDGFVSREAFDKGFNLWVRGYDKEGYEDAYNEYQSLVGKFGLGLGNDRYRELAGEVEARNVQGRMDMTPEERRASLASETEDVAREDQLFIGDALGVPALMAERADAPAAKTSLEAKRQAALDAGASLGVPIVVEETPAGGRRRAKDDALGWYDTRTGAVHVNPGNHADAEDVKRTVLHEAVGHMGMRRLLEGKHPGAYDAFLDRVHASMPAEARAYFLDYARRSQAGRALSEAELNRIAADEYVAALAEVGGDPNVWQKVVAEVRNLLRALGFDLELSEADIRALLYESRHNLESAAYYAERELMRREQKEFRDEASLSNRLTEDEREMADDGGIEDTNGRFNEQLASLTAENADNTILSLGSPSDVLLAAGIADKPMRLYGNKIMAKIKKHGYPIAALRDLPRAVATPIAVFNGSTENSHVILTELRTKQGNIIVSLEVGKGGADVDFNVVTSAYGKNDAGVVNWINKGLATYIDKKKALDYISVPAPIAGAQYSQGLSDATKVIESFENPKLDENASVLYRMRRAGTSRDGRLGVISIDADNNGRYGRWTRQGLFKRASDVARYFLDDSLPLRHMMTHIKRSVGGVVTDATDLWRQKTMVVSRARYRIDEYNRKIGEPLMKTVRGIYRATKDMAADNLGDLSKGGKGQSALAFFYIRHCLSL